MDSGKLIQESKALLAAWFRNLEVQRASGELQELQQIEELTDDELLKKWIWTITIYGVPIVYIGIPVALFVLSIVFNAWVMQILWFLAKVAMGVMLLFFALTIVITFKPTK